MRKFKQLLLFCAIILIFQNRAYAVLRSSDYVELMNNTFCIEDTASKKKARELWIFTLKILDETDLSVLKKEFAWFKEENFKKNLVLHYGWEVNPERHLPLMKHIEQSIRNHALKEHMSVNYDYVKEQQKRFTLFLREKIQRPQEDGLTSAVEKILGVRMPSDRSYSRALAAIVYDLHILTEYEASPSAYMQKIEDIEKNLSVNMIKLTAKSNLNARGKLISRELKEARYSNGNNKTKAKAMINVIRNHISIVLNEKFQKELRSKGIILQ